ncbi:MAG TPA: hypothetical protein VIV61_04135 [Candidatus Ozemobacteraceae bacterium]
MLKRLAGLCFCAGILICAPAVSAKTPTAELNDAVLFFVNDPQELTFCNISKLVDRNEAYHRERNTLNDEQVSSFYRHMQEYGVIGAGQSDTLVEVGYVVSDAKSDVEGVIVVKGQFDRTKLLEMLKKHYTEHSDEHADAVKKGNKFAQMQKEAGENPFTVLETTFNGHPAHIFPMPLRDREMVVVSTNDAVLISSAKRGSRNLLARTLDVVTGKLARREPAPNTQIVMHFAPTPDERGELTKRLWARYDQQKKDSISQKKRLKKFGERIRQRVIRSKVDFIADSIEEMDESTLTISRGRSGEMTKTTTLVSTFESDDRAADVKKGLMKHLIKEIKRNDNVQDKFAMGNISITSQGKQVVVRCQLRDSKEQLHAFNLISSYVVKSLLERL